MLDVSSILSTCDSYFSSSKFLLQMFSAEENDGEWFANYAILLIDLKCCFFFILRYSVATIPHIKFLLFACCKNSKTRFLYSSLFFHTSSFPHIFYSTRVYIQLNYWSFTKFHDQFYLKLYCMYAIKYAIFLFANKHYVILNQILRLFELQAIQIGRIL